MIAVDDKFIPFANEVELTLKSLNVDPDGLEVNISLLTSVGFVNVKYPLRSLFLIRDDIINFKGDDKPGVDRYQFSAAQMKQAVLDIANKANKLRAETQQDPAKDKTVMKIPSLSGLRLNENVARPFGHLPPLNPSGIPKPFKM